MTHIPSCSPSRGPLRAALSIALVGAAGLGVGCESDYTLGNETPTSLPMAEVTPTPEETPPEFTASPTQAIGTPEPGAWAAAIRVEPASVDLGALNVGCGEAITLTIYNDGTVPVDITNLRMVGRAEAWDLNINHALGRLEPQSHDFIYLDATAQGVGEDDVSLQINATEGLAATVPIRGAVFDLIEPHIDTYYQQPKKDVDVLWVIDNSGSMGDDQKALADNFDAFMNYFVPMGIRYHMGVTTTDMGSPTQFGKLQGSYGDGKHYIDWTMREQGDDAFRNTIKTLGTNGSSSERGLEAMKTALGEGMSEGHNAGFLREDANLAVVFVSDEEDQSLGYTRPNYYQDYVDFLVDLKGSLDQVVCSAIIDPNDVGGYPEVAYATNGIVEQIRGNYYTTLLEIGRVSAGFENAFAVSAYPDEGATIVVTINGVPVPPGEDTWAWDPETGQVIFSDDAIPEDGDRIDISYEAPPECIPVFDEAEPTPAERR